MKQRRTFFPLFMNALYISFSPYDTNYLGVRRKWEMNNIMTRNEPDMGHEHRRRAYGKRRLGLVNLAPYEHIRGSGSSCLPSSSLAIMRHLFGKRREAK